MWAILRGPYIDLGEVHGTDHDDRFPFDVSSAPAGSGSFSVMLIFFSAVPEAEETRDASLR